MTTVRQRFQAAGHTAADWSAIAAVPLVREVCIETDTGKIKIGNGVDVYDDLDYLQIEVADIIGIAAIALSGSASDLVAGTVPAGRMPAHTGDVTNPAGSLALTLATVNANVGSFGDAGKTITATVNGKGLVTAFAETAISITASQVSDFSEATDDRIAALLVAGSNISLSYNDAGNALTIALAGSPALTGTPTAPTAADATSNTQIATTAFVHSLITNLINASPSTLDTLKELADAIGDDPNFATTVATSIATKLAKASNLSDLTDAAAARINLGVAIGSNVQAWDADLDAIAALASATDKGIYATGAQAWAVYNLTQSGRALAGVTWSAGTQVPVLTAAGTAGLKTVGSAAGNILDKSAGDGLYQPLNTNLTTLGGLTATTDNFIVSVGAAWASRTPAQVRTTLGLVIGTNVQSYDADLDALAALSGTNTIYYRSAANTWSAVTIGGNLGFSAGTLGSSLGTMATQAASAIAVTGGTASGLTLVSSTEFDVGYSFVFLAKVDGGGGYGGGYNLDWNGGSPKHSATGALSGYGFDAAGAVNYYTNSSQAANTAASLSMQITAAGAVKLPRVGTTATAANAFLDNAASNNLLRSTSSRRYKREIQTLESAYADAILALRPVWYRSRAEADDPAWGFYGLIAEEVAAIDPRLVSWTYPEEAWFERKRVSHVRGEDGKKRRHVEITRHLRKGAKKIPDGVQYERLSVLLLDVVRRQEGRIAALEAAVEGVGAEQ